MIAPTIRDVQATGYELQLAAVPEAVRAARGFVTTTLHELRVSAAIIEAAELVTSELTTNAVRHTGCIFMCAGRRWWPPDLSPVIWVRVRLHLEDVIVEVWDRDSTLPAVQETQPDVEGGRGLLLVAALSEQWGFYSPPAGGKIVWAQIADAEGPSNY